MADNPYVRSPEDVAALEDEQRRLAVYEAAQRAAAERTRAPKEPILSSADEPTQSVDPRAGLSPIERAQVAVRRQANNPEAPRLQHVSDPDTPHASEEAMAPFAAGVKKSSGVNMPPGPSTGSRGSKASEESDLEIPRSQPAQIIPGGMRPYTSEVDVHEGRPASPEVRKAYGLAAGAEMTAAEKEKEAAKQYYGHVRDLQAAQLKANEDARIAHATTQAEREQMAQQRIAHIEALNKEAQGNPEDLWNDRAALAKVIGLFATIGGALSGNMMAAISGAVFARGLNAAIDQDIAAKLQTRKSAGQAADREMDLLKMHEQHLGDKDKAIEATRLAYYDNLLQQLEVYKAEHNIAEADPRALKAQGVILTERAKTENLLNLQGQNDIKHKDVQKYAAPQVVGGGGATGGARPPNLVVDPTTKRAYAFGSAERANKAQETVEGYTKLKDMNNELLQLRKEYRALGASVTDRFTDPDKWERGQRLLRSIDDLTESKIKTMSQSEDKSVVREAEHERAVQAQGGGRRGLGLSATSPSISAPGAPWEAGHDEVLERQNKRFDRSISTAIESGGGDEVRKGFSFDAKGNLVPTGQYTGRTAAPRQNLAPAGSTSKRPGETIGTASEPATEREPIFDAAVSAAQARNRPPEGKGGGGKKKKE